MVFDIIMFLSTEGAWRRGALMVFDMFHSTEGAWRRGALMAEGQNLARLLMESPANVMTPTRFAEVATEKLGTLPGVDVRVR